MSDRRNIIWITLDSVRADHTTIDGYDRDTTLHLERIAADPSGVDLRRESRRDAISQRPPESVSTWLETECKPITASSEAEDRITAAMKRQLHHLGYLE